MVSSLSNLSKLLASISCKMASASILSSLLRPMLAPSFKQSELTNLPALLV